MTEEIRYIPADRGITKVALMRGDEELSRTLVVPMTMTFGRAEIRMDGIGGVATPEAHRFRGYSRRVLEAAVAFMTAGDAVLSTLYGIPHFYPKYGFATLGPEFVITPIKLDERHTLPDGYAARDGTPSDLPVLQRLYREETARAYGPLVRDDSWWSWEVLEISLGHDQKEVRVVERAGSVVGYAWRTTKCWWMEQWQKRDPSGLKIGEAFSADHEAAEAVLAACRRWATDLGEPTLQMAIPKTCRVAAAAHLQNVTVSERYYDEGQFMGRATGLLALMRALAPELEARWRPVSTAMPAFALTLVTEGEHATITGNEDGIDISSNRPGDVEVRIDAGSVARLVLGGFDPGDVLDRLDVPPSSIPALTTIFPRHVPYIYPIDRF